jgi:rubredoxin
MEQTLGKMNLVTLSFEMATAVRQFMERARSFYYIVMLFGCRCLKCNGSLSMVVEGGCRCDSCHYEFDPTVAFARCSSCGGVPVLKVRRYQCRRCGCDIRSPFLFDGIVYDAPYFCRRMAESRQRKAQLKRRVQEMLADCRSGPLALAATDLGSVPGLVAALDGLTGGLGQIMQWESRDGFNLDRYQGHVRTCLKTGPADLRHMPPLIDNHRLDLIWRFIAVIFLEQAGLVHTRQQGLTIWVMRVDDREGQGLSGESEETDGFEGPQSRAKAW